MLIKSTIVKSSLSYTVRSAVPGDFGHVVMLLERESLPVEDIPTQLPDFFVIEDEGRIVATIGLEIYGKEGLLRSLVVEREFRNKSLATALLNQLLFHAGEKGIRKLFLITTTAESYFLKKGFKTIERDHVPTSIRSSREFGMICPSTATVMIKEL